MLKGAVFTTVAGAALIASLAIAPPRALAGQGPVSVCVAGLNVTMKGGESPVAIGLSERFACGCDRKCRPMTIRFEGAAEKATGATVRRLNI